MNRPAYGIVGRGRVAHHMARYLDLESLPHSTWHRGMDHPPGAALGSANTVLLAISDDALESFLAGNPELSGRRLVHFSGSLVLEGASGLHPLMTFGPEPYDIDGYRSIPFVGERGRLSFEQVFPALPNPSWAIEPELKPLYHALCVMAGNFPTMLWSKAIGTFEARLGLPAQILRPYLERTLDNSFASGGRALTGPLARGDQNTVARNLDALGDDPFSEIYRAFAHSLGIREVRT